jgi:cobalamin biosynthesis protein CobD/CbiB
MSELLIAAGGVGLVAAAAALWLESRRRIGRRCFAGLLALAIGSSIFSLLAWAAAAMARIVPLPLTWAFAVALAVLFAVRLYRELQVLPGEPR